MDPVFFSKPDEFRAWLEQNHATATELWVGYHKKGTGTASLTWPESVDEALCFGWIDGVRRGLDAERYAIRFTPRKPTSTWSAINVERVADLRRRGLMRPAGLKAFERRSEERTGIYSYERPLRLSAAQRRELRDNEAAWEFFRSQPPWYRRTAEHWVASAKREDTRRRRLTQLIEDSARGRTIRPLTRLPPSRRS